eukprot:5324349-Pyramimonas_sp.AAC.1
MNVIDQDVSGERGSTVTLGLPDRRKGPAGASADIQGEGRYLVAQRLAARHCAVLPDRHPCRIGWHVQLGGLCPRVSGHRVPRDLRTTWPRLSTK